MKIETLTKTLTRRVRQGDWVELLPSRNFLSEEYQVSPASVSLAIKNLEKEGLVRIVPRKGVFVVEGGASGAVDTADTIGLRGAYLPTGAELAAMDARNLFNRAIFNGIWERANHERCPLLLLPGTEKEKTLSVSSCREVGVKGIIFLGGEGHAEALELRRHGFPVIMANRPVGGTPVNFVDYDAAGELHEIIQRFIQLGHKRIGVLCPASTSVPGYYARLRLDFIDILSRNDIEISPSFYWKTTDIHRSESLSVIVREWMDAPHPPTAVFTWVPILASKFRNAVFEYTRQKAEHLSIACSGYSYENEAEFSGFIMPHKECGAALLSGLHQTIRNPFHVVQKLIACRYVEKGTIKRVSI